MGSPISNNTACLVLNSSALDTCHSLADTCASIGGWVTIGTNLIAIPILSLAGEMVIEGLIDSALVIRDIGRFVRTPSDYRQLQDEKPEIQETPPLWKRAFSSVKRLTTATSLTTIAIVTLKIGSALSASSCEAMGDQCPEFAGHAVELCNWTNGFLISVIDQVIAHHFS